MLRHDGCVCGRRFARKQSLWLHQDRSGSHDKPQSMYRLVKTNHCPKCETILSSYKGALQHMKSSLKNGFCKPGLALFQNTIAPPTSYMCRLCEQNHVSLDAYNKHVQECHLDHIEVVRESPGNPEEGDLRIEGETRVRTMAALAQSSSSSFPSSISHSCGKADHKLQSARRAARDQRSVSAPASASRVPVQDLNSKIG